MAKEKKTAEQLLAKEKEAAEQVGTKKKKKTKQILDKEKGARELLRNEIFILPITNQHSKEATAVLSRENE